MEKIYTDDCLIDILSQQPLPKGRGFHETDFMKIVIF